MLHTKITYMSQPKICFHDLIDFILERERHRQGQRQKQSERKKDNHSLLFRMEHVLAIKSMQFLSNGKERSDKKRGLEVLWSTFIY